MTLHPFRLLVVAYGLRRAHVEAWDRCCVVKGVRIGEVVRKATVWLGVGGWEVV